jgi:hypothetical protein
VVLGPDQSDIGSGSNRAGPKIINDAPSPSSRLPARFQESRLTYANMGKSPEAEAPADVCPVDDKTRAAWLKANPTASFPGAAKGASDAKKGNACDSEDITQAPPAQPGLFARFFSSTPPTDAAAVSTGLGTQRVVSTIPRASPVDDTEGSKPANSEKESGVSASGNWIYPSEKMFFDAMKRKVRALGLR